MKKMARGVKPRFRIILPTVYLIVSGVLFGVCFLHLAHSVWCQYFLESMFPAGLIRGGLLRFGIVQQGSQAWRNLDELLLVPVPFLLTVGQYYLIGLLIDRFLSRRIE
jgi:hypothetical protein